MLPRSVYTLALTIVKSKSLSWYTPWITHVPLWKGRRLLTPCIQTAPKTLLSLARKFPPQGRQVPDALHSALEKLRLATYPRIDKHHTAWYSSLPVLLAAWVARGSLAFQDLQVFCAQFESTLDMPPPNATQTAKPLHESTIVDLTGADDPVLSALPPKASESAVTEATASVSRDTGHAPDGVPPALNGFLT